MNEPTKTTARINLGTLLPATIVRRRDRFTAVVKVGETEALAHVADSGRLKELVYPGNLGMVRKAPVPSGSSGSRTPRATSYDLVLASVGLKKSSLDAEGVDSDGSDVGHHYTDLGADGTYAGGHDAIGQHSWVSIDTRYPNKVFRLALINRVIPEFACYTEVRPEFSYGHARDSEPEAGSVQGAPSQGAADGIAGVSASVSTGVITGGPKGDPMRGTAGTAKAKKRRRVPKSRLDFLLRGEDLPPALVEVKSVSLCVDGRGLFPDAPTVRGARHLRELIRAVSEGYRAYSVFIAQRSDVKTISPNRETDPDFADTLREAQESGVRLLGFSCSVTPEEIVFDPSGLPVVLD